MLIRLRNHLYDLNLLKHTRVEVPVVSVGNVTVGGTGKTPLVLRLAEEALKRGFKPGVVARGYKGSVQGGTRVNDEGELLLRKLPGIALALDPDRRGAVQRLVREQGIDLVFMDDGFQHRRLARDLDIVVLDATRPFGFGRLLPAGLLREPLAGLRRGQVFVLTRCDQVEPGRLEAVESTLRSHAPQAPVFRTVHAPSLLVSIDRSSEEKPETVEGQKVFLFSGIAHPKAFERTMSALGAEIAGHLTFPDHHAYTKKDLDRVAKQSAASEATRIITTSKDSVKLTPFPEASEFWHLEIGLIFQEKEDEFWELIFNRVT